MSETYTTKKINALEEQVEPTDQNLIAIGDANTGKLKRITVGSFLKKITDKISELNGKLSRPKTTNTFTNIGGSDFSGHTFAIIAQVIGARNTDGVWTIHINGKISTNTGATGDTFKYGIRLTSLKSAIGATGHLDFIGGNYITYKSDGTIASYEQQGYAGALYDTNGVFLSFGRFYKIDGSYGLWPANVSIVSVNNIVHAQIILQEI